MHVGTLLFVHGTGVRLPRYRSSFKAAKKHAADLGIKAEFVKCAWGDPLGIEFKGFSLPDPPSEEQLREEGEDFARWSWLFDDPLFELDKLMIRDTAGAARPMGPPGLKPEWLTLWERISAYKPSLELDLLLKRGELQEFWTAAWATVTGSEVARLAYERSVHELPVASEALARAVVAELHILASDSGHPGPSRSLRNSLVQRLLDDWEQVVYAPSDFFINLLKRA